MLSKGEIVCQVTHFTSLCPPEIVGVVLEAVRAEGGQGRVLVRGRRECVRCTGRHQSQQAIW